MRTSLHHRGVGTHPFVLPQASLSYWHLFEGPGDGLGAQPVQNRCPSLSTAVGGMTFSLSPFGGIPGALGLEDGRGRVNSGAATAESTAQTAFGDEITSVLGT